jgi:hypothetical protein
MGSWIFGSWIFARRFLDSKYLAPHKTLFHHKIVSPNKHPMPFLGVFYSADAYLSG